MIKNMDLKNTLLMKLRDEQATKKYVKKYIKQ
jgi:hypothetical protein